MNRLRQMHLRDILHCRIAAIAKVRQVLQLEYSTDVSTESAATSQSTQTKAFDPKPFHEIPTAKGLPLIGSLLDYTPWRGFDIPYLKDHFSKQHEKYGDIYRENIVGRWSVFCRSPADTEIMFRSDGRFPDRQVQISATKIREKIGVSDFITNFQGEEWYTYRKLLNPMLLQNKAVWKYIERQQIVSKDMVEFIGRNMDENGEVPEFDDVLRRWALEMAGTFILDQRLGLLHDVTDPEMDNIRKFTANFFDFFVKYTHGFKMWLYYETKEFKEAVESQRRLFEIIEKITKKSLEANADQNSSILQRIMDSPVLDDKQKKTLQVDLLIAAFETTSMAASLMLYSLTLNLEYQEKMREEVMNLPQGEKLTGRTLDNMEYMNAFIKETMRMFPFSVAFGRTYSKDMVFSGYHIPAGIPIVNTTNSTNNLNPKYFRKPNSFMPERYMTRGNVCADENKFLFTGGFGFGARACVGRRFAMQEIRLLLIEVLTAYRVEYHHKPIVSIFRGTGVPSEKSRYKFIPLKP